MFFLQTNVYYIIFTFSWQMSILYYGVVCKNSKGIIIGLIPVNGLLAIIAWYFLKGSQPVDLAELYLSYFIVESLCLIAFRVLNNKYFPITPIIQRMDKRQRTYLYRIMFGFNIACFILLVFELLSYKKGFQMMQVYVAFNLLLLVNIIINSILGIKIRSISQNINSNPYIGDDTNGS